MHHEGKSVNPAWHFDDAEAVQRLRTEAASWLGTPFREFSRAKGEGGGVDWVGLCEALMIAAGVIEEGEFLFPRESADYQSAATKTRILDMLRGQRTEDRGQSERLAQIFAEIPLTNHFPVAPKRSEGGSPLTENLPSEIFLPGDLLILRHGGLFHMPIILEGRHFINCMAGIGVREGNIHDPSFSRHLIALFRARSHDGGAGIASTLQPFNPLTDASHSDAGT